jgi:hypothetical protein
MQRTRLIFQQARHGPTEIYVQNSPSNAAGRLTKRIETRFRALESLCGKLYLAGISGGPDVIFNPTLRRIGSHKRELVNR